CTLTTNLRPFAADDSFETAEGHPLTIGAPGLLSNDTDANGDALLLATINGTTTDWGYPLSTAHGQVTPNADGSFTYTPAYGFSGTDSFTYQASDGKDNSNEATVSINVIPLVAVPDTYSFAENTTLTIDAPGVLANDTFVSGIPLQAWLNPYT